MKIFLVNGTYELFRNHFGAPPRKAPDGREAGATPGLLRSLLMLLTTPGITHAACAFDHVIESFRNEQYPGYKTGTGVDPNLIARFELSEEAISAPGLVVWSMVNLWVNPFYAHVLYPLYIFNDIISLRSVPPLEEPVFWYCRS